jgi:hypothetical protein
MRDLQKRFQRNVGAFWLLRRGGVTPGQHRSACLGERDDRRGIRAHFALERHPADRAEATAQSWSGPRSITGFERP